MNSVDLLAQFGAAAAQAAPLSVNPAPAPPAGTPVTDISQLVGSVPAAPAAAPPLPGAQLGTPPAPQPLPFAAPPAQAAPMVASPAAALPVVQQNFGHHNVESASLGDETVATGEFESYKGRKDQIDRLSIIDPNHVVFARVHYIEDAGFIVCNSIFQKQGSMEIVQQLAPCCERMGPPKKRFSAMVVHYMTDNRGRFQQNVLAFTLKIWRFGESIFEQLRTLNSQYPLDTRDVLVNCSDEGFQRMTITPCTEYMLTHEAMRQHLPTVAAFFNSMRSKLDKTTGKRVNQKEMADILLKAGGPSGFGAPPPIVPGHADVPATDVNALLNTIGGR